MSHRPAGRARGFTLIEVMVALLIFAIGVLGAVGMQARALQSSTQNQDRARAAVLANDIISTAWALDTADSTSSTTLATYVTAWKARVKSPTASGLPNVTVADYQYGSTGTAVTITWQEPSATSTSTYTTTFLIP